MNTCKVNLNISLNTGPVENSKTVAGGYGLGNTSRELCFPYGLAFDDDQSMIIADWGNHRVVRWKIRDTNGQVIAGGSGQGKEPNQLNCPTDLLIDKQTNSLIICDHGNRRVVRWSRVDGTTEGEILLDDITCWGLAMDNQRYLYISDIEKNEVIRYHMEDNNRTVVAGGHERGFGLNQLNGPTYIFVDQHQNLYVSDTWNHRVMKWDKDATEGSVIVEGFPRGLFVDVKGDVYVADYGSHKLICCPKGETKGTVIAGGNAGGEEANQLYYPWGLSSDRQGNLYVADHSNHRVQRFPVRQTN